jgi:hypothetical protein
MMEAFLICQLTLVWWSCAPPLGELEWHRPIMDRFQRNSLELPGLDEPEIMLYI